MSSQLLTQPVLRSPELGYQERGAGLCSLPRDSHGPVTAGAPSAPPSSCSPQDQLQPLFFPSGSPHTGLSSALGKWGGDAPCPAPRPGPSISSSKEGRRNRERNGRGFFPTILINPQELLNPIPSLPSTRAPQLSPPPPDFCPPPRLPAPAGGSEVLDPSPGHPPPRCQDHCDLHF